MSEIREFLRGLELDAYAQAFEDNEVRVADLSALTGDDLRDDLGMTRLLDRKKLLDAISALHQRTPWPDALAPDKLPTPLALPYKAMWAETHPRVRLHWLVDTAELTLRWAVAVALGEVRAAHGGQVPAKLARQLRDNIERPTLGRWLGILRDLSAARPAQPLIAPGVFDLYEQTFAPRFDRGEGADEHSSLLILRNNLAHHGGQTSQGARDLLAAHLPNLHGILSEVLAVTARADAFAMTHGQAHLLRGLEPQPVTAPEALAAHSDGTWLVREDRALALMPLVMFGPVRRVDSASGELRVQPGAPATQLFARADADRLSYTPLGRDEAQSEQVEVSTFREVFRYDEALRERERAQARAQVPWQEALHEAKRWGEELVGRAGELLHVKRWVKQRDVYHPHEARIGHLSGGPGLGKSILLAKLATDYSAGSHHGLLYHRMQGSASRQLKRTFLRHLQAALCDWAPLQPLTRAPEHDPTDLDALIEDVLTRLRAIAQLPQDNPRATRQTFRVLLDGLDELIGQDPDAAELIGRLALPGTLWLVCGRAGRGLDGTREAIEPLFEGGLPLMSADDLRAMLIEGLGNARYALLRRDTDGAQGVENTFVSRVVQHAQGLPLYVHLLLSDLRSGALSVRDDDRLPEGLTAYYDALMSRAGLSSVKRDLPFLVCALARAQEPLTDEALAMLLAPELGDAPDYLPRVQAALRAGQALLRRAPAPGGGAGHAIYHQSFQDYITGRPEQGVAPAPALADTLREVERKLYRLAARWDSLPHGALRDHLFRFGTDYTLSWHGEGALEAVVSRLTDYAYLNARLSALPAVTTLDLVSELERVVALGAADEAPAWLAFLRERAHLLMRGEAAWPAHKILLQQAMEHSDDSPITRAAQGWLERGEADWLWLRRASRAAQARPNLCERVYSGHTDRVEGALWVTDEEGGEQALSWSKDGTLRLWDATTGATREVMAQHTDGVDALILLDEARAVSASRDGTLVVWELIMAEPIATLAGHTKEVLGVAALSDDRLVSWSKDKTIIVWQAQTGEALHTLTGHTRPIRGAALLSEHRLVSWGEDRSARVWDLQRYEQVALCQGQEHTKAVLGALGLRDGRLVTWSMDHTLVVWALPAETQLKRADCDLHVGEHVFTLEGHSDAVIGARQLDDAHLLSWSKDGTLRLWSLEDGQQVRLFEGHKDWVDGVMAWDGARLVSWSKDATARVWARATGACLATLTGHASWVRGATRLRAGALLTWSGDGTLRGWDLEREGAPCVAVLEGHTAGVWGAMERPDGGILSWSWDGTLRHWRWEPAQHAIAQEEGHRAFIQGVMALDAQHQVSWSSDGELLVWSLSSGALLHRMQGHTKGVTGALLWDEHTLVSWASDETLRVWDWRSGDCLHTLRGHDKLIQGALAFDAQRLVSWSSDATLRVWARDTGACLHTLRGHDKLVQGALRWDDHTLVSWSSDATLRLWELRDGSLRATLSDHNKLIKGAKRLVDGRLLSWSSDTTLRLWDIAQARCVGALEGHKGLVQRAFALDERRVASLDSKDTCIIWDVQTQQSLHTLTLTAGDDRAALLDDTSLLTWSRQRSSFTQWDLSSPDAARAQHVSADVARSRPELWRARAAQARYEAHRAGWHASGEEGGVTLWHDDGAHARWCESGQWSADLLHHDGLIAHAGSYLHALHLYRGAERQAM